MKPFKPTPEQLAAAAGKTLGDIIAPDLQVLFCGINPSLYSAAVGHHFARPGNRFWPSLYGGGFTPRLYSPWEDRSLPALGLGMTNVAPRATVQASELSAEELAAGGRALTKKVQRYRPKVLAVLGVTAYRQAFARPTAALGVQPEEIGDTVIWLLPNPSGLNAHYTLQSLAGLFAGMREALQIPARQGSE